jgi:uncharacterized membrane protein
MALRHRLRRVYFLLLTILFVAWGMRITIFASSPWRAELSNGLVPPEAVVGAVSIYYLALVSLTLWPKPYETFYEIQND